MRKMLRYNASLMDFPEFECSKGNQLFILNLLLQLLREKPQEITLDFLLGMENS